MKPYFLQDLTALGVRLSIPLSSRYSLHRTSHPIALFRLNTKDYNNSPHVLSISVPGTAKQGFQNDCHSCRYQEAACQTRKTWSNCQSLPPLAQATPASPLLPHFQIHTFHECIWLVHSKSQLQIYLPGGLENEASALRALQQGPLEGRRVRSWVSPAMTTTIFTFKSPTNTLAEKGFIYYSLFGVFQFLQSNPKGLVFYPSR